MLCITSEDLITTTTSIFKQFFNDDKSADDTLNLTATLQIPEIC